MRLISVSPAVAILVLALTTSVFAADKDKNDSATAEHSSTTGGGSAASTEHSSGGGGATAARSAGGEPQFSRNAPAGTSAASGSRITSSTTAGNSGGKQSVENHLKNGAVSPQFANGKFPKITPDFNRGNHYGGRWSAAKEHPGWSHNGIHIWNHRHYRWFDGGWLVLDDDFGDDDYAYPGYYQDDETVYAGSVSFTSIVRGVQAKLASEGYYAGAKDGSINAEFRKAIQKYQGNHGLHVTGLVDPPLIESLEVD